MTTLETLKENNDPLYEGLDSPATKFKFKSKNLSEGNPESAEESVSEKSKFINEFIEKIQVDEDTKEILKGILNGSMDDEETVNKIYEKIKNFPKEKLDDGKEINKLIQEITQEFFRYAISDPKKLHKFITELHLPMDKKDILRSLALSTLLPAVGIPMAVDPMSVNAFYNSNKLQKLIKDKIKSDTKLANDTANKITKELSKIFFEIK